MDAQTIILTFIPIGTIFIQVFVLEPGLMYIHTYIVLKERQNWQDYMLLSKLRPFSVYSYTLQPAWNYETGIV